MEIHLQVALFVTVGSFTRFLEYELIDVQKTSLLQMVAFAFRLVLGSSQVI